MGLLDRHPNSGSDAGILLKLIAEVAKYFKGRVTKVMREIVNNFTLIKTAALKHHQL